MTVKKDIKNRNTRNNVNKKSNVILRLGCKLFRKKIHSRRKYTKTEEKKNGYYKNPSHGGPYLIINFVEFPELLDHSRKLHRCRT